MFFVPGKDVATFVTSWCTNSRRKSFTAQFPFCKDVGRINRVSEDGDDAARVRNARGKSIIVGVSNIGITEFVRAKRDFPALLGSASTM